MSSPTLKNRRPGRWLMLVIAICISVPALMTMQGCCSWCLKHCAPQCPPSRVHFFVFYAGNSGKTEVAPQRVHAVRSDCLVLRNTTQEPVRLTTTVSYRVFEVGNDVTVAAGEEKSVRISPRAELGGVSFDMHVAGTTQPGPGVDIDD